MTATFQVGKQLIELDKDGFLKDLTCWNIEIATALAKRLDITLTEEHWEILNLLREFYQQRGVAPVMRILVKIVDRELGAAKGNSLYLLKLFPESPARIAALIAGLPRPTNCL